jgi:hypothetical protein
MRWNATLLLVVLLLGLAGAARAQYGIAWPEGRLEIEGRLRLGWHHRWLFEGDEDANKNRFYVQQARLKFAGWQYEARLCWEMQFELRGYNGLERETGHEVDHQGFQAKDLHLSWVPSNQVTLRLGQMKVPYGRKQLVPQHAQSAVKRGDVVDGFLPGRDRGLMLRLRTPTRHWTGWAGVYSGNGANRQYNDSFGRYLWVGRLQWQPLGDLGNEEGDFDREDRLRLLLGANAALSRDRPPTDEEALEYKRSIDGRKRLVGGDLTIKWRGWFLFGEFDHAHFEPEVGRDFIAGGWVGQMGVALPMEPLGLAGWLIEPVLGYDEYNPSHRTADDTERTVTAGVNLLPDGHDLKLMINYYHRLKLKDTDANPWKEDEIRAIVQMRIR